MKRNFLDPSLPWEFELSAEAVCTDMLTAIFDRIREILPGDFPCHYVMTTPVTSTAQQVRRYRKALCTAGAFRGRTATTTVSFLTEAAAAVINTMESIHLTPSPSERTIDKVKSRILIVDLGDFSADACVHIYSSVRGEIWTLDAITKERGIAAGSQDVDSAFFKQIAEEYGRAYEVFCAEGGDAMRKCEYLRFSP